MAGVREEPGGINPTAVQGESCSTMHVMILMHIHPTDVIGRCPDPLFTNITVRSILRQHTQLLQAQIHIGTYNLHRLLQGTLKPPPLLRKR
jgi:hypothetical protein